MLRHAIPRANIRLQPGRLVFAPEWIILGVNNLCNLHCKMCDVGVGYESSNFFQNLMGARPLNMPLELINRILDQTARYFPNARVGYAFTEPGIYPHLIQSLAYADSLGLSTAMTTNGLRVRKMAAELADAGLDDLFIQQLQTLFVVLSPIVPVGELEDIDVPVVRGIVRFDDVYGRQDAKEGVKK